MSIPNTRKLPLLLALFLIFGALASPALAQGAMEKRWWSNPRVVAGLGLSAEQQERIEAIVYENESVQIDLKADEKKANLDLVRLLDAAEFDQAAVDATIDRIVDARCSLTRSELESRAAIAAVLSQDQRMKLMEFVERVRERRGSERPLRRRR